MMKFIWTEVKWFRNVILAVLSNKTRKLKQKYFTYYDIYTNSTFPQSTSITSAV